MGGPESGGNCQKGQVWRTCKIGSTESFVFNLIDFLRNKKHYEGWTWNQSVTECWITDLLSNSPPPSSDVQFEPTWEVRVNVCLYAA